jgi:hypothetical protein
MHMLPESERGVPTRGRNASGRASTEGLRAVEAPLAPACGVGRFTASADASIGGGLGRKPPDRGLAPGGSIVGCATPDRSVRGVATEVSRSICTCIVAYEATTRRSTAKRRVILTMLN